jgi:hypothetical protein
MPRKPQHRRGRSNGSPSPPPVATPPAPTTPTRRSSRPPKKSVRWADDDIPAPAPAPVPAPAPRPTPTPIARPAPATAPPTTAASGIIARPVPRKPARLRWGPTDTRQRVTLNQAARKASLNQPVSIQIDEEEDKEEEEEDFDTELERREEEDLEACQEQAYLYRVSFVLKALLGSKGKRTKWQGKIRDDDWVTGAFDTDSLDLELGQAMDRCNFQDNLLEIVISVKSDHSKGT